MGVCHLAASISLSRKPTRFFSSSASNPNPSISITFFPSSLNFPTATHFRSAALIHRPRVLQCPIAAANASFHGECYVVGDNIDTDQIIPAEYLTLVPSNPSEYEEIGSYAFIGLPSTYTTRFISPNEKKTKYSIVIAGENFGCGSSREHAPVAMGAAGVKVVVAGSYARIFFRNAVATGEVYPLESEVRVCEEFRTGEEVTVEMGEREGGEGRLINHTSGKEYRLKPIGDAGPVVEAGGIFAYARKTGMIPP